MPIKSKHSVVPHPKKPVTKKKHVVAKAAPKVKKAVTAKKK